MNILNLPPNTRLRTKLHFRSIDNSIYDPRGSFPLGIVDDISIWLEFTVDDIFQLQSLVTEIDLSSKSKFWSYSKSDIDWLLYCCPGRKKTRGPQNGEIVEVSIDNVLYRAVIRIPYFSCVSKIREILIKATIIHN